MPLPDDFDHWQHLLEMLQASHNRRVLSAFSGVPENDISTDLGGMRVACFLNPDDTVDMILLRLYLFYFVYKGNLPQPVYATPVGVEQAQRKFKPQIHLHFKESYSTVEAGYPAVVGEIKVRLMRYDSETITTAIAREYALKIKEIFGAGTGFSWRKGKDLLSYTDPEKGYGFKLLCFSKSEGLKVIEAVLQIQSHSVDLRKMSFNENQEPSVAFPVVPPSKVILGKNTKEPRRRPVATTYFQYALLHVHGRPSALPLYDKSHKWPNSLIT